MKKAYLVLAMKRSGHHAVIYWIAHNLSNRTELYNDCCKGWKAKHLIPNPIGKNPMNVVIGGKKGQPIDNAIFNIEDFDVSHLERFDFSQFKPFSEAEEKYVMIILRDPYNWIASCIKGGGGPLKYLDDRVNLWKKQAKFCASASQYKKDIYRVSYNRWFTSEEYRKSLSVALGMKSYDKGINLVPPRGNGSSFDARRYNGKAQDMKVLERWKEYKDDPRLIKYFKGTNLPHISEKMFGFRL